MRSLADPAVLLLLASAPAFGSFLTVVVDRLPRGETLGGRSCCPTCGQQLAIRDLVPVLSWLALGGRCRRCDGPIAGWLPLVEVAALVIAVVSALLLPPGQAWLGAALGWMLLALAMIDFRHLLLPDVLTLPLLAAGLAVALWTGLGAFADAVIGAAVGGAALATIGRAHAMLRRREALGFGDVKLFAGAGAWVGWQGLPTVMLIAALSALAWAALSGHLRMHERPVPFGPFIGLGLWLTWLVGPVTA